MQICLNPKSISLKIEFLLLKKKKKGSTVFRTWYGIYLTDHPHFKLNPCIWMLAFYQFLHRHSEQKPSISLFQTLKVKDNWKPEAKKEKNRHAGKQNNP